MMWVHAETYYNMRILWEAGPLNDWECALQLRANARKAGQEYIDKAFMHGRFPSALPRLLTARNGQLTPQQQYVYEDFARIPRTAPKEGESSQ